MPDPTLSEALKEAYASAPASVVLHTLELRHPAFSAPLRVVRDYEGIVATLEAGAPANGGEAVSFVPYAFDLLDPEVSSTGVPELTIILDNVRGSGADGQPTSISDYIELALTTTDKIQATYRAYLENDLTQPQNNPPLTFTINHIQGTPMRVQAKASFGNLPNRAFPNENYNVTRFPGLAR